MIPTDWTPHHREDDGELVGYLVPRGDAIVPVTLFGYPLGPEGDEVDAVAVLEAEGLSCLADHWWLADAGGAQTKVKIYEVRPDGMRVMVDDFGAGGNIGSLVELPVPETGRLQRH